MIGLKAKVTNTAGRGLDSLLAAFQNQQDLNRDAAEAAEPVAVAARALIRVKTGRTQAQIQVWANEQAAAGTFGVFVGVPGPDVLGAGSRGWIGRLLEFGTSKRAALPWLRPANDTAGGPMLMRRFAEIARKRVPRG